MSSLYVLYLLLIPTEIPENVRYNIKENIKKFLLSSLMAVKNEDYNICNWNILQHKRMWSVMFQDAKQWCIEEGWVI